MLQTFYVACFQVRASGVRAAQQARVTEWAQVEAFLASFKPDPFAVVIKPAESAGSDGVYLCKVPLIIPPFSNHVLTRA